MSFLFYLTGVSLLVYLASRPCMFILQWWGCGSKPRICMSEIL